MYWGMGNHLGPFSEVSDRPEGQEQGGGAVGSQEGLQVVKPNLGSNSVSEHARYMVPELLKVDFTRSLCSDTETPQVTHFGYLGFIFWCMPFL